MRTTIFMSLLLALAFPPLAAGQEAEDRPAEGPEQEAEGQPAEAADPAEGGPREGAAVSGKPGAPVRLAYNVIGTPVVGQPLSIAIEVASTVQDRPVTLHYGIHDAAELAFPDAQPRQVSLGTIAAREAARQQVRVVPQREGRLYLNVVAEVETEGGALLKAMAIPIQVGDAPSPPGPQGRLLQDAEGESVISLPASE